MKNNQLQTNTPLGWQELKLANIFEFKNGLNKEKKYFGHGTPIINYIDVYRGGGLYKNNIFGKVEVNKSEIDRFNVKKGDVFFTRTSETLKEIGFSAVALDDFEDAVFSGFVLRARPKGNLLTPGYSQYYFKTNLARKEIMEKSSYTTRALTSGTSLNHVNIKLPPIPEQNRIVSILETWDKAIDYLENKIIIKKQIKKGLMQNLLSGKKRLKGFTKDWELSKLGNFLINAGPRNRKLSVSRVLSVTNKYGFILPEEQFARVVASADLSNYKIVFRGDFAYNPSRINVGSISRLDKYDSGVLSPMYVVFKTNEKIDSDYFYHWLDTAEANGKIRSCASGSVRESVDFKSFCSIKINVPDIEEQRAIADILNTSEEEITILENKLKALQEQKRYLLNNLITGTIRTPEILSIKVTQ